MIDKESKRLNREELLEILIEQAKEITALQSKILRLEEELENKKTE